MKSRTVAIGIFVFLILVFMSHAQMSDTTLQSSSPNKSRQDRKDRPLSVLVLLGEWFGDAYFPLKEEIEARGWIMKRVGIDKEYRGCYNKERDILLRSDILIADMKDFSGFDCLMIPSGPQWRKFNQNPQVLEFIRQVYDSGMLIASFCVGNVTVRAAGLIDSLPEPDLFPEQVTLVRERILLGPRGGGPPPGDGFKSAPIKEICDEIARELINKKDSGTLSPFKAPYLGQKPPGIIPEIFAPGIVSTKEDETAFEISSSGKEIVFIRKNKVMILIMNSDGSWNKPAVAPFSGNSIDDESCFSPGGNEIYFMSRRNCPRSKYGANLWVTRKNAGKWTEPEPVQITINTKQFHAPSIASNGNLYDTGIIKFIYENGKYSSAQKLTPLLKGISPFVAPDESYLIFSQRLPNHFPDLYITFKNKEGKWTNPLSLGDKINSPKMEGNSFVTSDGKYLFFTRAFDIYWVSAKIIEELRPKE